MHFEINLTGKHFCRNTGRTCRLGRGQDELVDLKAINTISAFILFPNRRIRQRRGLQQQAAGKVGIDSRRRPFDGSIVFVIHVVHDLVRSRLQATQLHLPLPRSVIIRALHRLAGFVGRVKSIKHVSVFFDRVSFGSVVAINIQVQEISLRKHLVVIQADPFFPARLFSGIEVNIF